MDGTEAKVHSRLCRVLFRVFSGQEGGGETSFLYLKDDVETLFPRNSWDSWDDEDRGFPPS